MTDENNQDQSTSDAPQAPVRRTRARRAATSPVTTPAPSTPAAAPAPSTTPDAGADQDADAEAAAAPRKRARRTSSTRSTGTDAVSAGTPSADTAPEVAEEVAPAAPKRSRRATSTAKDTAAAPAAGTGTVPADAPAPAEAAPERPQRSRRATRSVTAPTSDAASDAADAAPADEQESSTPARRAGGRSSRRATTTAQSETLDVLGELGGLKEDTSTASGGDEAPRMSTTALLFQAPDPASRPKRRRAQAPAGPPKPLEDQDEDATTEDEDVTEEEPTEEVVETPTPARRSRRGSRRSGATEESATAGADAGQTAERSAGDDQDEDDDEDDTDGSDGSPRRRRRRGGRGRRSRSGGGDGNGAESARDSGDEQDDDERGTADDGSEAPGDRTPARGRSGKGDTDEQDSGAGDDGDDDDEGTGSSSRRRRRRRRGARGDGASAEETTPAASSGGRSRSRSGRTGSDEVTALKGSTRLEAKRQRRREGRDAGRRRTVVTEAEFLARREAVDRSMVVREANGRVQIAVLEDDVLVEHFVSRSAQNAQSSMAGNVYLGRVQNVLPSMEAAFVDVGKGRNAVLYAGEVNWDAAGLEGQPRRIEQALKSGDSVLVQVTKDPIGHKGARLTSQITLAGRYLVYVPAGGMTGISRKLPENERARLKKLLKEIVPDAAGVIVRTAAEGASEEELRNDVQRLQDQWAAIQKKAKTASAPALLQGEPDLAIRVVRDIFNDDFGSLVVQGDGAWSMISEYVGAMAPDLASKVSRWDGEGDVFAAHRIDEQLAKGMDRKVYLPSGGSLVIDRTEAMTVVDVNTGKFTGSGGTLEETVTRNNLEAAEEIVRQLRLRDIGGIIVIDFIDMVLESNRDLVLRRLVECLGRDRTKHQVAEVTSLGLVQMTRKRVGQGLVEAFSETCEHCNGRGFIVHTEPIDAKGSPDSGSDAGHDGASGQGNDGQRSRRKKATSTSATVSVPVLPEAREAVKATLATIAAAAAHAHEHDHHVSAVPAPGAVDLDLRTPEDGPLPDGAGDQAADGGQDGSELTPVGIPQAAEAELSDVVGSIEAVEAARVPGDPEPVAGAPAAEQDDQPAAEQEDRHGEGI